MAFVVFALCRRCRVDNYESSDEEELRVCREQLAARRQRRDMNMLNMGELRERMARVDLLRQ